MSDAMKGNCSFVEMDHLMRNLELVFYVPIFICGLLLNTVALLVFCVLLRKWTESTLYMTSLALMDLLLLFPLPFKMHASSNTWSSDMRPLCSLLESLYFIGIYGSIYTIVCIAVDRWVAICHPFRAKQLRSPRAALGTCVTIWVLVLAAISPNMHSFREAGQEKFKCFHGFSSNGWRPSVIVCLQLFGFLLPVLVVLTCSLQSIWTLQKSARHNQQNQRSQQSRACINIILSSLGAFLLPFTPSHIAILLQFLVHQKVIQDCALQIKISLFLQISLCLSNVSCCLDAFCYYFIAHEVRSTKHTWRMSLMSHRRATSSTSEV